MKIRTDNVKINNMIEASLESMAYRQDLYSSGGIVESDKRVKGGGYYGAGMVCYPRVSYVIPWLEFGEYHRVKHFLEFWKQTQSPNGEWRHCYRVDNPYPLSEEEVKKAHHQTDNVGYILWHSGNYYRYTEDNVWLRESWEMLQKAVEHLLSHFNSELQLIWGEEEEVIDGISDPKGFFLHINSICASGLQCASHLAQAYGNEKSKRKWLDFSKRIKTGIEKRLWNSQEKRYSFGIDQSGRLLRGTSFFCLMPAYFETIWNEKLDSTFWYLRKRLYNRDPKISHSYWHVDHTHESNLAQSEYARWAGIGPWLPVSAIMAMFALRAGYPDIAKEQTEIITKYTPESDLLPEHINTIHPGVEGSSLGYGLYPAENSVVDPGNLFCLSYFLNFVISLIGKVDNKKTTKLCPCLPDNIHRLTVKDLKVKDAKVTFEYLTDAPKNHGSTKICIRGTDSIHLEIFLRYVPPLKRVIANGKSVNQYKKTKSFSGKVHYAGVSHLLSDEPQTISVQW